MSFLACASAVPAQPAKKAAVSAALTNLDILNLSVGFERPGLNAVVVINRIDAANLSQVIFGWLHVAGVIHRARLQQELFAVPIEFVVEANAGFGEYRRINP